MSGWAMQFNEDGEAPGREGRPGAREQLVAVAVEDTLLILSDLERRNAIDPRKAGDRRWAAIRVSGTASAEENARFWSGYAELVVLSERLKSAATPATPPPPLLIPAAQKRLRLAQVARYAAVVASLCAVILAFGSMGTLTAPQPDEAQPVAVASGGRPLPAAIDVIQPVVTATVFEAEPAYNVAYGRDHPNFPQPVQLPARFDPPQMDM